MQPYAGIKDVDRPGFSVPEAAQQLLRLAATERQMLRIAAGHLQGIPEWDVKATIARHLWEDAEHTDQLFTRIDQLRAHAEHISLVLQGPLGLLLEETLRARTTLEYLVGVYRVVKPALTNAYRRYLETTNPLADYPTVRSVKAILAEERAQIDWGSAAIDEVAKAPEQRVEVQTWQVHLSAYLEASGGITGDAVVPATPLPPPRSSRPFQIGRESARDATFKAVVPKQFTPDTGDPAREELIYKFWVRLVEMTAAETVATIIYEWEGMPWPFYHDLARHCWDETRHALFGQAAMESEGLDFHTVPQWVGYALHQMALEPMERYAHLAIGEARYMRYPPGARYDFEWMRDVGKHALFARFLDFDWADEVLHAQFGRRWIVQHQLGGDIKLAHQIKDMTDERRRGFYIQWARDHPDELPVADAAGVAAKSDVT